MFKSNNMRPRRITAIYESRVQKPYSKPKTTVNVSSVNNDELKIHNASSRNDQVKITNYFIAEKASPMQEICSSDEIPSREDCIFGWTQMGKLDIPYIVKQSEKYCAIRMIKQTLAKLKIKPKIGPCQTNLKCVQTTGVQCRLLNEINDNHCDSIFGRSSFTTKDSLVRLDDANKYFQFVEVCQNEENSTSIASQEELDFGFILVNKKSYVPYTKLEKVKFVPLIYFECDGDTSDFLKTKSQKISGENALFLKFCCKYDGTWNEMSDQEIDVIDLNVIKKLSPPRTTLKECWPTDDENYRLLVVHTVKGLR